MTSEDWYDAGMVEIYAFAWDYDLVGNRTYQRDGALETYYEYDVGNALVQSVEGGVYSYFAYDSRGNCTEIQESDGTVYFTYNHANLVTEIKYKDGMKNRFWYDAMLRRYAMEDSDGLRYFTWDQNGVNLLTERDSSGEVTAEYVHGYTPVEGIGSMVSAKKSESEAIYYQYPVYDHRGTVYRLTDENGDVTEEMEYNAWGQVLENDEMGINASNRFGYQSNWGVQYAHFSRRGTYLIIQMNNDARSELIILDQKDKRPLSLPQIPNASIHSLRISKDESMICFYATNGKMPSDLFVYNLKQKEVSKLTSSLSSTMKSDDLVSGEVVRFSSYDGLEVPGILYKPHQASPENKCPALVWVHGGPGGQSRIGYSALIQYLTNHGYVIYAINNRGSSGYGKTFYQLDDRKHGDADLKDCLASKKMLIDTGYVNKDQIGIIGGSYGGYMVLAALAFTPEEFEVGVDIFGVANWVRTLNSIPSWWEAFRKALEKELGEFDDTEYLTKISPLFHAEKIKKPLMVLQGANDPRVLKAESDEIVAAVKKNNVPVEYIVFDDEGHGFRKKKNREKGYEAILLFLDKYLRK